MDLLRGSRLEIDVVPGSAVHIDIPLSFANPYGGASDPAIPVDPTVVDPAWVDPAATDPTMLDQTAVDPALADPAWIDPAAVDPVML